MKVVGTVARYLVGLIFSAFGINGFLHFLPMQPMPQIAMQFLGVVAASHFLATIFALQLAAGILLLVNRYVPLALTVLGAIIFNILLFHLTVAPSGLPTAAFVAVLWGIVALCHWDTFAPLFYVTTGTAADGTLVWRSKDAVRTIAGRVHSVVLAGRPHYGKAVGLTPGDQVRSWQKDCS